MKTLIRLALMLFAGLTLAGCANQTASIATPAPARMASWGEQPLNSRDYWMQRDLEDKFDRSLGIR